MSLEEQVADGAELARKATHGEPLDDDQDVISLEERIEQFRDEQVIPGLKKAERAHRRAMTAPVGSNQRTKMLQRQVDICNSLFAAGAGLQVQKAQIAAWANEAGFTQIDMVAVGLPAAGDDEQPGEEQADASGEDVASGLGQDQAGS